MTKRVKIRYAVLLLAICGLILSGSLSVIKAQEEYDEATSRMIDRVIEQIWAEYELVDGDACSLVIHKTGRHEMVTTRSYKEPAN